MTERSPLVPVEGLARTARIAPPVREPRPQPVRDTEPAVARSRPAPARINATAATVRAVSLSLPLSVVEAVRRRAVADRISQAEVLMDALAATRDRLADLVAGEISQPHAVDDGLFLRAVPKVATEPMTTLSLRLLSNNLKVIDEMVKQNKAPSRSVMCALALRDYLT